jgi:hypothetical protein
MTSPGQVMEIWNKESLNDKGSIPNWDSKDLVSDLFAV